MRKVGIGSSNFATYIETNSFLIDKSLLIRDLFEDNTEVYLFPRPRRFGKSLNISMLKYFFEKTEKSNAYLFQDFKISQYPNLVAKHQGQYPVIDLPLLVFQVLPPPLLVL